MKKRRVLIKKSTGDIWEIGIGFNWGAFFFGILYLLYKKQFTLFGILFGITLLMSFTGFGHLVYLINLYLGFAVNKLMCDGLIRKGYNFKID